MKSYIIGVDIGTTNIKGSAYSSDGNIVSNANISYQSYSPKENYHEQDPDDWVDGFIEVLHKILINSDVKENLKAISISTQGGTVIPVDKDFNPLCRAITWLDRRGAYLLARDKSLKEKNIKFYLKTGWRLDSNMSFLPLLWLKENKKDIFNRIYKIFFVNDYVYKKITGISYQDPSNSSISLFYNIIEGRWDNEITSLLGFTGSNFSRVKNPGEKIGYLDKKISKELGIKNKVLIINGSHDQYCVGIGSGIVDKDEILLATGTAWVIFKMLNKPLIDSKKFFASGRFTVADDKMNDKFGLIYSIPAAGVSLKWFATNLMDLENEDKLFEIIDENTDRLDKIKNNIIFYPYLTGAYGPDFNVSRKASFLNVEMGHNYLDLIKAIMEGVGFQLNMILAALKEKGISCGSIKMTGGGAKSKIWPQIIADITKLNILVPEDKNEDFAAKGAAILAGYGVGIFSSLEEGYGKLKAEFQVVKPKLENMKFYKNKFDLFLNSGRSL
jgi:xylulokinase